MNKKIIGVLILVLLAGLMAGCVSQGSKTAEETKNQMLLDTIKKRGTIRIGTEGTYPPFSFKNDKGELNGYDVDVIREVAKHLGVEAEFVPTEWKAMFTGLDSDRFDVIANQVGINDQRKEKYDFSSPYTVSGVQIIVHKDTMNINSLEDLKGKKVGVSQGSNYEEIAKKAGANIQHYKGSNEILADLAAKRIEAGLNDRLFVAEYLMKNPDKNLKATGKAFDNSQMAFTFRKGSPELVDAVNKALEDMQSEGTLKKISEKWFGEDVSK